MTVGFGMSIGTVNSVWAATTGEGDIPVARVRRTAVTFDGAGGARIGGLPRFAPVVTDFADLTREIEPVVVGGRIWTSADLVAAVATCLIGATEFDGEPVITYPACYSDARVAALRHAMDWAGATRTLLMPEPVAAAEWLDAEYGVSDNGLTLVYDLGGNSLDVAVVRTEADREKRGVLGKPLRSYEYGGRPLGTTLARYARALAPDASSPVSKVVPADDTARLRTWNIRNSLRLVRRCVRAAGLTIGDVDRILLVGGAARPVEVAQVIAELGRPVVLSPDPAHTVAEGAALASFRMADTGANLGRYARGAVVLSSAAVASAVAMSAATMLGGGPIGSDGPVLEFAPALAGPAPDPAPEVQVIDGTVAGAPSPGSPVASDVALPLRSYSKVQAYSAVVQTFSDPRSAQAQRALTEYGPGTHCAPLGRLRPPIYSDPARFINPLPFASASGATIPEISLPRPSTNSGNSAPHHHSGHDTLPRRWDPADRVVPPAQTSSTEPVAAQASTGTPQPVSQTRAGSGLPEADSAAAGPHSTPGNASGTSTRPGSQAPGTAHSGAGTSTAGDPASTDTGGALSSGGNTTSAGPAGGGQASGPASHGGDAAAAPNPGSGLSNSPESTAPHDTSGSFGGATPHWAGGGTSNNTSSSPGGATSHHSLGGVTSNEPSHSFGGSTSNGPSWHSPSTSAGGNSFGGGVHGGSMGGGFHGGGLH